MTDYPAFGKIPRWYRDVTITEKIDGTNGLIHISTTSTGGDEIAAGSRNRWLTADKDNYGFHAWVMDNATALIRTLGSGYHYGEWWGSGIQRRYGLTGDDKRFSLFNTHRWSHLDGTQVPGLYAVPVLYQGTLRVAVTHTLLALESSGSKASPGFMNPEGVVIYHSASGQYFKATLNGDGAKGDSRAA